MRDFILTVATIAIGILVAAAVVFGTHQALRPSAKVNVDLSQYTCATDGRTIECSRK